jgi:hypothetical protein
MGVLKAIIVTLLLAAFALHLFVSVGTAPKEKCHKETLVSGLLAIIELAAAFAVIAIEL